VTRARVALRCALLAALLAGYWIALRGHAQDAPPRLRPRVALLAFEVARTAFNEALDSPADLGLIWSIVEHAAPTIEGRRRWLRHHSPCVSGILDATAAAERPGNCRWARNLYPHGEQPTGWSYGRAAWRRMRPRWERHLRRSLRHAAGDRIPPPCDGQPTTWDGRRWRERAEARGFRALTCRGTRNLGYVRAEGAE